MITRALIPAAMCVALAWPVMAATTDSSTNTGANSAASNGSMNNNGSTTTTPQISAKLRQSLAQSGYTDIQVVPEAFLVHAKDKGGNPVMMMVRPNSVTEITQLSGPAGTGSGAQPGMNGNNATGSGQSSGSTSGQTKQ